MIPPDTQAGLPPATGSRVTPRSGRRKAELEVAAAHLFLERGYHNVSMDDIAAAVGITGPALYRHFKSKHEVLVQALSDQLALVETLTERVLEEETDGAGAFARYLDDLGGLVLQHEILLWKRERRHLTGTERELTRQRVRDTRARTAELVRRWRPELSKDDAQFLGWSVLSIYSNTADWRGRVDRATALRALEHMARAVASCDLAAAPPSIRGVPDHDPPTPAGRRERVLAAATRLFWEHGYYAVSVEAIAEASDTAIATVYQLFSSKNEVLRSILTRGADGTQFVMAHRLAYARDAESALDSVVSTHAELSCGPHGALYNILSLDLLYLPEDDRDAVRRSTHEYVEEWAQALRAVRPEMSPGDVQARVRTAIAFLGETAQVAGLRKRPNFEGELRLLASAILHS